MKIMCHVGPWSSKLFEVIAQGIDEKAEVLLVSGHKSIDQSGMASRYYDFLRQYSSGTQIVSDTDFDMIKRCRLLRAIDTEEAKKHLDSMRASISEVFDSFKPDLVISETIDSFLMDLIYAESVRRNIKFIGLVPSFVNGYFRVTARGEYNKSRSPSSDEIDIVLTLIEQKNYHPAFLNQSKKYPKLAALKRWSRNLIKPPYFLFKRAISGEKYNYHYWATQIVASQWFHLVPTLNIGDADWKNKIEAQLKPIIYVPLQMIPEATVDYWCENLSAVEYDNTLIKLIERLSPSFHFLIKEHPNVLGFRNPAIYKQLNSMNCVTICPTSANSNQLIELCNAVLVWTGTVGFEAAIRGKPVLSLCKAYYMSGRKFKIIEAKMSSTEILGFIKEQSDPLPYTEKQKMVAYLLSGLLPGRFKSDGSWSQDNKQDFKDAKQIGASLAALIAVT